ncbi:MAG TPA: beta-hydroxyacyl-ACP dehydratase [Planctomycetaceae bacterium]|nr:beta-hydroxyacyl-ACP dehydratase [Planctomycetaceae bacterium]HRE99049.1 3-hydroxyacyl-ACP dehydratase FabZ family protein [Pirellulaceae bacterium]
MRWFWIDRFVEFTAATRAVAVKCVSLSEPHVVDYVPGLPQLPNSLIVEGLAQTGGLLVSQTTDFRGRVVLAKVGQATFHAPSLPGERLVYTVEIQSLQGEGAVVAGRCEVDGAVRAEVELTFAILDDRFAGVELFEPAAFLRLLRSLHLFHVGRTVAGDPVLVPEHLVAAERASGLIDDRNVSAST